MPFFHYIQNNSGGSFDYDEVAGITHHVIIEAENATLADSKLESIGGYFDGCANGRDCSCCGDRWYPAYEGDEEPLVYGNKVTDYDEMFVWMKPGREIAVHYADGRIEWFGAKKK